MPQGSETIRLTYAKEKEYGIAPNGYMRKMRFNSESFNGKPTTKESAEVRSDAQPSGQRIVGLESGGGINAELCPSICHHDFIAAAMRGEWSGTLTTGQISQAIDATAKTITRSTGSYVSLGFRVGDFVKLSGFVNAVNNVYVQLTAVTALVLDYAGPSTMVTEASSATAVILRPDYIDWGTTDVSYTLAKDMLDLTDKSLTYTGQRVGGMTIDAKYGDIAMISFTLAGSGYDVPATPLSEGRLLASGGAEDSLNATSDLGLIMIDGVQTTYAIEDISIKLDNSLIPINGIGTLGAINQRSTGLKLSINLGVYLENGNFDFHAKKLAQTPLAITYYMCDANNKGFAFQIPAAQFSFDDAQSSGRGAVAKLSLTGTAKNDATLGTTFRIYKLDPIDRPKVAIFGNSIATRSQIGDTIANSWSAWGHLNWIHALSNASFDRARSTATSWGDQGNPGGNETIDQYGVYGWGGATNSLSGTYSMLNHLPAAIAAFIDTPDIAYLANLFENDIANGISSATIISDGLLTISHIRAAWPNATIIVSCPNPSTSYDSAGKHTVFDEVSTWIQSLPDTYTNLVVESNTATTIQSGEYDQPIAEYTSDNIIHPNERGAFVRAKAFLQELGYLFTTPYEVPKAPYESAVKKLYFQVNPDFSVTGGPGMNNGQYAGLVLDNTYKSYDWYSDTNIGVTVSANTEGGVNVTLTRSGAITNGDKCSATSDASTTTVVATDTYAAYARLEILNPSNLFGVGLNVDYTGGTEKNSQALFWQSAFKTAYPQGISDLLEVGDVLTLMTPPLTPGTSNVTCNYTQTQILGCATMPLGAITSASPSMRIIAQNVIAIS